MYAMAPVVALVLLLGAIVLVAAVASAVSRRPQTALPPPRTVPPQAPPPDPTLARVKRMAWDHRDLDPPLADELIAFLNAHEVDADQRAVRNEVAEIAWRHRETCPDLSTLVIDLVRRSR